MHSKLKILIDTDPGTDDAMALLMVLEAHKQNLVQIIGITTVHGNSSIENVNVNLFRLLELKGLLEIPVFCGASQALVQKFHRAGPPFHGYDGFGDTLHSIPPVSMANMRKEQACLALVRLVQENKGEVVMVALGPLTNLALAVNIWPEWSSHLKDIYVMGGNISGQGNVTSAGEFNFVCDPEAAYVVLERTFRPVKIVPWETCLHSVKISYEERNALGKSSTASALLLNSIEKLVFENSRYNHWVSCDQIVMAWMLHEQTKGALLQEGKRAKELISKTEMHHATVELNGCYTRGQMVLERRNTNHIKNVTIGVEINREIYMDYLKLAFS